MVEPFKLKNPPIIEAVLDIECELPAPLDLRKIESQARKELVKSYPKLRHQFFQEHHFEAKTNEPPRLSVTGGIQALQFLKPKGKQLVQFRVQGFSFNRLAPYTSLDDYLPQIKRGWTIYSKFAAPVKIRSIRLRYINRILLPIVNGSVDFEEYLNNAPCSPDPENLDLLGFVNQYAARDKSTGHQTNSVLTLQPVEGDKLPIIFDNGAISLQSGNVDDWPWIRSQILELRELKNRIFWRTLKERCLSLF